MENSVTPLSELTIEIIVSDIFINSKVKKRKIDIVNFYKELYKEQLTSSLFNEEKEEGQINEDDVRLRIEDILKSDQASDNPYLAKTNAYYTKAKRKGTTIYPSNQPDTNYTGKAGECAVMGELLFRGYNVNNMMVDEGIDLVASKNNVFFYIQVKTKSVIQQNRVYFTIKQERFDTFVGTQIRYILVARCQVNKQVKNIYFVFTNNDIQRFVFKGVIPSPSVNTNSLSVKIEFDERTGKAFLYDGKQKEDISFNINNFEL